MKTLVKQILLSFVQNGLRRMKNAVASPATIEKYLNRVGYTVALRADYYSPLTSVSNLRSTFERWNRPSALKGIEYDLDHMKSAITDLLCRYLREFSEIPPYNQLQRLGFGPGYTAVDALMLYMMIRHIRPKRYIEVGSGLLRPRSATIALVLFWSQRIALACMSRLTCLRGSAVAS